MILAIGSNFVLDGLACAGQLILKLDALIYAHNAESHASLRSDARYRRLVMTVRRHAPYWQR